MKIINDEDSRIRRPPSSPTNEDEITDDDEEDTGGDDGDRYYWQPTYDDRRGNRYNNQQKVKTTSTTTRKSKMKYPSRETTMTTLIRGSLILPCLEILFMFLNKQISLFSSFSSLANGVESDNSSHTNSFLRESSVILLLLLGIIFTIILLVLVGFYCRDSWKRGRIFKNRSTDADYLINGLYL